MTQYTSATTRHLLTVTDMTDGQTDVPVVGFPVFSLPSVRLIAEQTGVQEISDDVLLLVSEDLTYRVRELISNSLQFTRYSGRIRLSTEDLNQAFKFATIDLAGSCHPDDLGPNYIQESDVYLLEEREEELVATADDILDDKNSIQVSRNECPPVLNWLVVDGRLTSNSSDDSQQSGCRLSPLLTTYYDCVLRSILSDDGVGDRIGLQDLSENTRIQPIVGHILNALSTRIKSPESDTRSCLSVLNAISQILRNESLFLGLVSHQKSLLDSVLDIVLMSSCSTAGQNLRLRRRAAAVLALACDVCTSYSHVIEIEPHCYIVNRLNEFIVSFSGDFLPMYGTVITCLYCGNCVRGETATTSYLTVLSQVLHLLKDSSSDGDHMLDVVHELPAAAGTLLSHASRAHVPPDSLNPLYYLFYEHFGDSITCFCLPDCDNLPAGWFTGSSPPPESMGWIESRSGVDLLDSFYLKSEEVTSLEVNGSFVKPGKRRVRETRDVTASSDSGVDVSGSNTGTPSVSSSSSSQEISVCTIFENYDAFPGKKKIRISYPTSQAIVSGESETAIASGQMTDCMQTGLQTSRGSRRRLRRKAGHLSCLSCHLLNSFL